MSETSTDWGMKLKFGPSWFDLSIGEEPDVGKLTAQVDARIGREPRLLDSRQKLIDMLVWFSQDATRRGAAMAAMRWALDEFDGASVATVYVRAYKDEQVRPVDQTLAFLQARMVPRHGSDMADPQVEVRELPAGKALRVQVISRVEPGENDQITRHADDTDRQTMRSGLLENVQYWLPIPGQTLTVVFTFSTPNLAGGQAIVEEFDQMIESLYIRT